MPRRGKPVDLDGLSFPELNGLRAALMAELREVARRTDGPTILGVPESRSDLLALDGALDRARTAPAAQIYAGVLYDALDIASLHGSALRRARSSIVIVSALWGAVRLGDRIPAYRLSMAVTLPGHPPLAGRWRSLLNHALPTAAGRGLIVDCRSSTYAAAWRPEGALAERTVSVRVFREVAGERAVVSHMAKHTRGLVARTIVESGLDPRRPERLVGQLEEHFTVELKPAPRNGHYLDVITD